MPTLRLVGGDGTSPVSSLEPVVLELRIRVEIAASAVDSRAFTSHAVAMPGQPEPCRVQEAPAQDSTPPVAGRIDAARSELADAIPLFLAALKARHKADSTVERWSHMLRTNLQAAGWRTFADIAGPAIEDFLTAQASAREWRGTTTNAHLSCWRCFCRWATRRKQLAANPLADADAAVEEEHGEGSRAPTTNEARALLGVSASFEEADGRSTPRLAYFACLFLAGCRYNEPARWTWADVRLDAEVPHVVWRGVMHKNRRRMIVALAPELVPLLASMRGKPDERVFALRPNPRTFKQDRDRAGVAARDETGRNFSPHGARKWLATTLANAGVPSRMCDYLMRHTGSVEARYYQPTVHEQLLALRKLPSLLSCSQSVAPLSTKIAGRAVDGGGRNAETDGACPMNSTTHNLTPFNDRRPSDRPVPRGAETEVRRSFLGVEPVGSPSSDGSGSGTNCGACNRGYVTRSAAQSLADCAAAALLAVRELLGERSTDDLHKSEG